MDSMSSFAISAAGMGVERLRVEAAALNLANAHTPAAAAGEGYRPLHVVVGPASGAQPHGAFAAQVRAGLAPPAARLQESGAAARRVLEPGHPLADAEGFVRYPGVDPAAEMVALMGATRAYEANVAAFNAARAMALKALEIGG